MVEISRAKIRTFSRLGQRGTFFGMALPTLAEQDKSIRLMTADLSLLSGMDRFIQSYPQQFINVGIAEQNMIGMAAGLAMEGECVFASTYASFIAVRSLEFVRQHLAHMKCNVKIVGSAAGVVAAKSGVSHWATEDIAFMRALPNLNVLSPADALEAYKMAEFAVNSKEPMYIRLSGALNCPIVFDEDYEYEPGTIRQVKEGSDIAILATGLMVSEALKAADELLAYDISAAVYNVSTIKPLDTKALDKIIDNYSWIVTCEEHNIIGGLGGAVAEYKSTKRSLSQQIFIGFQDEYVRAGSQKYIWNQVGIDSEGIINNILEKVR